MTANDDTRYVIFSASGYGNIGDDAIMLGTARYLITRQKAKDLFVFSYTPRETRRLLEESGLTGLAIVRSGYFFDLLRCLLSGRKKRILVGGGTLITNRAYLTLHYLVPALFFRLFCSEIHFFGVAAEEAIRRPLLKFLVSAVLRYSIKKAFVRDDFTKGVLENFADCNSEIRTIGDPALYLKEWEQDDKEDRSFDDTVQVFVSARDVNPRLSDYHAGCFAEMLDGLIEAAREKGEMELAINFLPFCVHKTSRLERDDLFGLKIQSLMKHPERFQIETMDNPIEIMQRFRRADLCICMRLHSLIFASMTGRKCVAISYSPKVRIFAKDNGLPYVDIGELEKEKGRIIDGMLEHLIIDEIKEQSG